MIADRVLGAVETMGVRALPLRNRYPPLFVVGVPRSGTTVVFQHLLNHSHFAYFPNRTRGHPWSCITRTAWGRLVDRYEPSYESRFGIVDGGMAPSDGWEIFHRWFPRYELDRPVDEVRLRELKTLVRALELLYGAPFANKNNANSVRIGHLRTLFPEALFLHVTRDRLDTACSLLDARRRHGVGLGEWWSAAPPQFLHRRFRDDVEQTMAQVLGVDAAIREALADAGDQRIECAYETFCGDPGDVVGAVTAAYAARGVKLRPRDPMPVPSLAPRRREAPPELVEALRCAERDLDDAMHGASPGAPNALPARPEYAATTPATDPVPVGAGRDAAERMREYMRSHPITHPGHLVARTAAEEIRRAAREHLNGRLLEIGCGTKRKALLVSDLVDWHVGLDHAASPHGLAAVDVVATAYAVPAAAATFDSVLSTAVLEHLEDPARALAEACRVLRPGGHAVYTAPLFWHLHEEPRDFFRYTRHGLRHLFEGAGFEVVELKALSGVWTTVAAQMGYYVQRFRRWPLRWAVDAAVAAGNVIGSRLDRGRARDERFTWMYIVVARKPGGARTPASGGA
ncbi:MAG: sulfotransferase [Gemmatimonadota bacterium]|jgi:SAM-dependent methyltransferase